MASHAFSLMRGEESSAWIWPPTPLCTISHLTGSGLCAASKFKSVREPSSFRKPDAKCVAFSEIPICPMRLRCHISSRAEPQLETAERDMAYQSSHLTSVSRTTLLGFLLECFNCRAYRWHDWLYGRCTLILCSWLEAPLMDRPGESIQLCRIIQHRVEDKSSVYPNLGIASFIIQYSPLRY